jgi:hypothetical protein
MGPESDPPELQELIEKIRREFLLHYGRTHHTRYRFDWPPPGRPVVVRREVLAHVEADGAEKT